MSETKETIEPKRKVWLTKDGDGTLSLWTVEPVCHNDSLWYSQSGNRLDHKTTQSVLWMLGLDTDIANNGDCFEYEVTFRRVEATPREKRKGERNYVSR